jgi:hypothetical protein
MISAELVHAKNIAHKLQVASNNTSSLQNLSCALHEMKHP